MLAPVAWAFERKRRRSCASSAWGSLATARTSSRCVCWRASSDAKPTEGSPRSGLNETDIVQELVQGGAQLVGSAQAVVQLQVDLEEPPAAGAQQAGEMLGEGRALVGRGAGQGLA